MINIKNSTPLCDTDSTLLSLANDAYAKFIAGEMDLTKLTFQLAILSGLAQDIFYDTLNKCEDIFGLNSREFVLDFVKLKCSDERLNRIQKKQENIKFDELSDWLLEIEGTMFNGINSYWFVPIINFDQDQPWMIIEQNGAPLDPEYSLVAVFTSKSDADHYFNENYDF